MAFCSVLIAILEADFLCKSQINSFGLLYISACLRCFAKFLLYHMGGFSGLQFKSGSVLPRDEL